MPASVRNAAEGIPPVLCAGSRAGHGLCVLSPRHSKWAKCVNVLQWFAKVTAQCRVGTASLVHQCLMLCSLYLRADCCQQFYDDIDFFHAINNSLELYLSKFIEVGVTYKIGPVSVRDVLHRV